MNVAIVDKETLVIRNVYWSPDGCFDPSRPDVSSAVTQILVPDKLDYTCILAQKDSSGNIILTADPVKVQAKNNTLWSRIRSKRNELLAQSDWTRLDDVETNKDAWAMYRQALRDITKTVTDPTQVTWPTPPS